MGCNVQSMDYSRKSAVHIMYIVCDYVILNMRLFCHLLNRFEWQFLFRNYLQNRCQHLVYIIQCIVAQVLIIAYFHHFSNKILLMSTLFITQQKHIFSVKRHFSSRRFCITLNRQNCLHR